MAAHKAVFAARSVPLHVNVSPPPLPNPTVARERHAPERDTSGDSFKQAAVANGNDGDDGPVDDEPKDCRREAHSA
jgi:hypothetical protein